MNELLTCKEFAELIEMRGRVKAVLAYIDAMPYDLKLSIIKTILEKDYADEK